jgi:hypothetical protein
MSSAAGPVSQHAVHVGTLMGPVLLLAFWASWSDLRAWLRRQDEVLVPTAALVAAALSVGAGAIHAIVVPAHLAEDLLYGGLFTVLAVTQLAWAVRLVVRPQPWLLVAGVVGNLAVVALWGLTRAVAVPFGAAAGQREAVGVLDGSCGLLELAVVACCAWLAWGRQPTAVPA